MIVRFLIVVCGAAVLLVATGAAAAGQQGGSGSAYPFFKPWQCGGPVDGSNLGPITRDPDGTIVIECRKTDSAVVSVDQVFGTVDATGATVCVRRVGTATRSTFYQYVFRGKSAAPHWQNIIFGNAIPLPLEYLAYTDTVVSCS